MQLWPDKILNAINNLHGWQQDTNPGLSSTITLSPEEQFKPG